MKPCRDCPFRPRVFTPLPDTADEMLDFVNGSKLNEMYCHEAPKTACRGAILFRNEDQTGVVFKDNQSLLRAHRRSRRPRRFPGFTVG